MLHVLYIMQLLVLRSLQLHVKLLTKRLQLLQVMVINGNGLLSHGGLCHLIHLLYLMVQGVLVHLQKTYLFQ